jgi:hypothetical protein
MITENSNYDLHNGKLQNITEGADNKNMSNV